uniref:Uncharacterized protein n=1 Tax=Timema monikensis TaxID=170555 RepID=A0A7R9HNA2_9NEOP|nr:unnamed protein product [Timema monikensis]
MGTQERYTGDNFVVHPSVITSGNDSYENDPQQRTSNPLPLRTQEGRTIPYQAVQNGVSDSRQLPILRKHCETKYHTVRLPHLAAPPTLSTAWTNPQSMFSEPSLTRILNTVVLRSEASRRLTTQPGWATCLKELLNCLMLRRSNIVLTPSLPTITLLPTATHVAGTYSCSTATHAAGTSFCSTATHIAGTVTLPPTSTHVLRPEPYRPTAGLPYVPQRLELPGLPHVPPRFTLPGHPSVPLYAAIYGVNIQEKIRSKSFVLMNQHVNEDIRVQARKIYEALSPRHSSPPPPSPSPLPPIPPIPICVMDSSKIRALVASCRPQAMIVMFCVNKNLYNVNKMHCLDMTVLRYGRRERKEKGQMLDTGLIKPSQIKDDGKRVSCCYILDGNAKQEKQGDFCPFGVVKLNLSINKY